MAGEVSQAVCVVLDVLRATTVIPTLFDRACPAVYVAGSHAHAERFAREKGYVLCGETQGLKPEGFDFGNSPTEFARHDFTGRPVVLSTTNGTKATVAVAAARAVFLGAAVNRLAVAEAAWQEALETDSDIVLVCSGTHGAFTLEDAVVAGGYVEALVAQGTAWTFPSLDDSAIAARRLWQSDSNLLRSLMEGRHAQYLAEVGLGEDIGYCATRDNLSIVPRLTREEQKGEVDAPVLLAP
jgi:2-phosphosulfolactate phosphatase